jgi:pentatricopeptide repeat protein
MIIYNTRKSFDVLIIPLLVALLLLLILKNDESSSAAFSPTIPTTTIVTTIRRELQLSCEQQRTTRVFSSACILSSSTTNNDYPPVAGVPPAPSSSTPPSTTTTNSDDRRNESLEQGHHPLWSLNLNLDSLAQAGAGSRAQELLKRIHALYTEGYYEVSPDIVSYNSVLKAWKEDEQPEAALELLETMIRNEREDEENEMEENPSSSESASDRTSRGSSSNKTIRVDVISFNTVIAAFANQGNYHKALELLRKMQKNNPKQQQSDFVGDDDEFEDYFYPDPDTITYNIVLYSLAQSNDIGTAVQAEDLLREMMMQKERTGVTVVDTTSFNTVLYAWSREREKDVTAIATTTANTTSIAAATGGATAKRTTPKKQVSAKMAAQRAEDLLTIMEELSEAGNLNVRPDAYSYTTTIQCWAKCNDPNVTKKAHDVLNRMIERDLQPNKLTYTALMNALSKAGQPERAEYVLHQMTQAQHQPDTVAFSSIIDGWARISSKDRPEAAARAQQILETMKGNASRGMGPTATTYTSVLTALAKSGLWDACDQALALLQDMEEDYAVVADADFASSLRESSIGSSPEYTYDQKRDKWSLRPTNIHYNCVLNAYAQSSRSDKAILAQKLMTVMENHSRLDCRPDTISYK